MGPCLFNLYSECVEVVVVFDDEVCERTLLGHGHLSPQVSIDRFFVQMISMSQPLALDGELARHENDGP